MDNKLELCAEYILKLAIRDNQKLSFKKLNLIMYYAYVDYLITFNNVMFEEKFHTWAKISIPELYEARYQTWMGDILFDYIEFSDTCLEDEDIKKILEKYYNGLISVDEDKLLKHICNIDKVYKLHNTPQLSQSTRDEDIMPIKEIYEFYKENNNFNKLVSILENNKKR